MATDDVAEAQVAISDLLFVVEVEWVTVRCVNVLRVKDGTLKTALHCLQSSPQYP